MFGYIPDALLEQVRAEMGQSDGAHVTGPMLRDQVARGLTSLSIRRRKVKWVVPVSIPGSTPLRVKASAGPAAHLCSHDDDQAAVATKRFIGGQQVQGLGYGLSE